MSSYAKPTADTGSQDMKQTVSDAAISTAIETTRPFSRTFSKVASGRDRDTPYAGAGCGTR
jgi:hypothetical protein